MFGRPVDVNAYDGVGETMPPAAGSSHLCWLPSRGDQHGYALRLWRRGVKINYGGLEEPEPSSGESGTIFPATGKAGNCSR
jgi:hypothetical protein